uniref:Uncharacterized protein n=1 Tax=Pithovirus LCPAC401 TaxID=2506595 RepID=A0A481Z9U5_9VIRU|nr:MAG: hypothetical protein LCPAC401_00340 [Pithovirus LCPAC401]
MACPDTDDPSTSSPYLSLPDAPPYSPPHSEEKLNTRSQKAFYALNRRRPSTFTKITSELFKWIKEVYPERWHSRSLSDSDWELIENDGCIESPEARLRRGETVKIYVRTHLRMIMLEVSLPNLKNKNTKALNACLDSLSKDNRSFGFNIRPKGTFDPADKISYKDTETSFSKVLDEQSKKILPDIEKDIRILLVAIAYDQYLINKKKGGIDHYISQISADGSFQLETLDKMRTMFLRIKGTNIKDFEFCRFRQNSVLLHSKSEWERRNIIVISTNSKLFEGNQLIRSYNNDGNFPRLDIQDKSTVIIGSRQIIERSRSSKNYFCFEDLDPEILDYFNIPQDVLSIT